MLVPGDLGFRVAVVFIFLVFPAICFVLRRKWRLATARSEEINRLLVLASEEAARAELEASFVYSVPAPVPTSHRHCAVCYTPTANRCARCKSVNYCSGKCQIIHWRQGHKDECRPPLASFENDETTDFVDHAVKQPYPDDYCGGIENYEIEHANQGDTAEEKPESTNPLYTASEFSVEDVSDTADHSPCEKEVDSLPEVHGISFSSVVHQSSSSDGMCIDISDDDSVHDISSESCDSCSTIDNLDTALRDGNVEQSEAQEEESYARVESDSNTSASGGAKEPARDQTNGSSGLSTSCSDKKSVDPSISDTGFWGGSLDSCIIKNNARSSNTKRNSVGSDDMKLSDSKSSLQYSIKLSGNVSSDLVSQGSEVDPYPVTSTAGKLVVEPTLPDKKSGDAAMYRSSTVLSPDPSDKELNFDRDLMKSGEVRTANVSSKENGLPSCSVEGANDIVRDTKLTSRSLLPKKSGFLPKVPNGPSIKGNTVTPVKSVKSGGNPAIAPQVTNSSPSAAVGLKTSMLKVVEHLKAPILSKQGDGVGKKGEKGVFPYDLFVKLYHWNKVELRPCGLINCGNSCYANAVLQCLAFTPPLTAYFLQGLHSKTCPKRDWCFTCEFERLILKAKEGGSPLSPISILSQIQKIGSHLTNGREEDAHEFLRYAIDTMQSICLQENKVTASSSLEEETTLTGLTFGGYLRSKIKCTRCRGKSERQERMMDLTVEIEGDIETLEDALRRFTGTESLDGENKYHCGRCKSYEKAKKKLSIVEAPNVLTIALKRFQSGKFGKLNKSIRFPEILNLAPYMRGGSDKSPIYRLYGVVVHLDIMNAAFSGHYVCYVRNAQNKWYKIDDSMVKAVELERVLNKGAYMLFYSRCSPRAPRSIRNTLISRDLSNKMKNPAIDLSRSNGRNSSYANPCRDDIANLHYVDRDETRRIPHILEDSSSSDSSSLFSHSDEVSSSTDSTRESITADDISDYIFGFNGLWRNSSDSDTSSSSSSSSSSPLYTKHSPLSNSERYASALSEPSFLQTGNSHSVRVEPSSGVGVSFLQSNSSKQDRKPVNISSCRGSDTERLGWANPLDYVNSGVHLRRSLRKKAD